MSEIKCVLPTGTYYNRKEKKWIRGPILTKDQVQQVVEALDYCKRCWSLSPQLPKQLTEAIAIFIGDGEEKK